MMQRSAFVWLGIPAAAALAMLSLVADTAAGRETIAGPVSADVVEIVDGDTIVVRARIWLGQRLETRVRLARVDAPEISGACAGERALARRARSFVAARLAGAVVTLHDIRYGKYARRVVARIETAAEGDLGAALLAAGLARAYAGGRRRPWC